MVDLKLANKSADTTQREQNTGIDLVAARLQQELQIQSGQAWGTPIVGHSENPLGRA